MSTGYSHRPSALLPTHEQRWVLAGSVLALVLLALLVSVMSENAAQAQSTRALAERQLQERGRCNALRGRLEREQCVLDLRLGEQPQITQR